MRRLLILAVASMVAVLLAAPTASAQDTETVTVNFAVETTGEVPEGTNFFARFPDKSTSPSADPYYVLLEDPDGDGTYTASIDRPVPGQNNLALLQGNVGVAEGSGGEVPDGPTTTLREETVNVQEGTTFSATADFGGGEASDEGMMPEDEAADDQYGAGGDQYDDGGMQPPATGGGMQELPDTGGPALLPLAGLMLVAGSALGYASFRRRS